MVNGGWPLDTSRCPLTPFHGFSSTLKSFRVSSIILPSPQLFYLIQSSPLLEDLTVAGRDESSSDDNNPHWPPFGVSLILPPLSGSLELSILGGMGNTTRRLLDLPNGLHFQKLTLSSDCQEDLRWVTKLVRGCENTLEFLCISRSQRGVSCLASVPSPMTYIVSSWVWDGFRKPLEGYKTQRCSVSVWIKGHQLGHQDTPDYHIRTSGSPTNLHLYALSLDLV